jgi:hypothetical protein
MDASATALPPPSEGVSRARCAKVAQQIVFRKMPLILDIALFALGCVVASQSLTGIHLSNNVVGGCMIGLSAPLVLIRGAQALFTKKKIGAVDGLFAAYAFLRIVCGGALIGGVLPLNLRMISTLFVPALAHGVIKVINYRSAPS